MMLKRSLYILSMILLVVLAACQMRTPEAEPSGEDLAARMLAFVEEQEAFEGGMVYSMPSIGDSDALRLQSTCASLAYEGQFTNPARSRYVYASAVPASNIGNGNHLFTQDLANFPEGSRITFIIARLTDENQLVMLGETSGTASASSELQLRATIRSDRNYTIALVSNQDLGAPSDLSPVQVFCEEIADRPAGAEYVGGVELCIRVVANFGERGECKICRTTEPDAVRASIEDDSWSIRRPGWSVFYDVNASGQCTLDTLEFFGEFSSEGTAVNGVVEYDYIFTLFTDSVRTPITATISGTYDENILEALGASPLVEGGLVRGGFGTVSANLGERYTLRRVVVEEEEEEEEERTPGVLRGLVIGTAN